MPLLTLTRSALYAIWSIEMSCSNELGFESFGSRCSDFAGAGDYRLPTDTEPPIEGLLLAYSRLMENPDLGVRRRAVAGPPKTNPPIESQP